MPGKPSQADVAEAISIVVGEDRYVVRSTLPVQRVCGNVYKIDSRREQCDVYLRVGICEGHKLQVARGGKAQPATADAPTVTAGGWKSDEGEGTAFDLSEGMSIA